MKTRWQRYKILGARNPYHWTKRSVVGYCKKCDRTFNTCKARRKHKGETGHSIISRKFYIGQRFKNLKGEHNGAHKLSETAVKIARALHKTGVSTYVIGLFFEISQQMAYNIVTGKSWKHI